ncbi:MAG TPA: hypothetical protein VF612_17975 [Jatrophihabitans sp.]|uniref:hypothetical protein n=1 Tax=Jatrophihabitans sp. TaxID=1932789 RepID=UPI002F091375
MTILLPFDPGQAAILPTAIEPVPQALPLSVSRLLAGAVERLYSEYGCCLRLSDVIDVVAGCVQDIQATPTAALPELTERLARHRLAEIGHRPGS